jgi:hypothetical protein
MKSTRASAVLGAAALTVGLLPLSAAAVAEKTQSPTGSTSSTSTTAACSLVLGSVTSGGDHTRQSIISTSPPATSARETVAEGLFADGEVRLSSYYVAEPDIPGLDISGLVVQGNHLYSSSYRTIGLAGTDPALPPVLTRIGDGWITYRALETSQYATYTSARRPTQYGLRHDGVLFRWTVDGKGVWQRAGSYAGFGSVKAMTLISKTATYDTFLMNLRGGALYTVRIPTSLPMKPVVKVVRRSTWQGFESLTAQKCGQYGVLLLGIDKDTGNGYLYAVGHANGTATMIRSIGKVPGSFADPVYFRWGVTPALDPIFGE